MTTETATITLPHYRTPGGQHTCAARVPDRMCRLYRIRRFGSEEYCAWTYVSLERTAEGYLQPCHGCPIREGV